jgi:hypothetical protein
MGAASPAIQVWTPVIPSDTSPKMWYLNTCRWKPPSGLQKLATFRYKNQDPNFFSNLNWEYVNQSIPMLTVSKDVRNLQVNLLQNHILNLLLKGQKIGTIPSKVTVRNVIIKHTCSDMALAIVFIKASFEFNWSMRPSFVNHEAHLTFIGNMECMCMSSFLNEAKDATINCTHSALLKIS